ncbi:MAG: carboxypeptidase regulatory-like domain-containing protein [Candidatus Zipacnadales bacterium]
MNGRSATTAMLTAIIALSVAGCGGGGGNGGTANVTGRVVDDGTLKGIVAIVRIATKTGVQTGADGRFSIAGLPTGTQTMTVTAEGYETYQETVTLVNGDNALGDIYIPPTLRPGRGAITGRVTLASGTAVSGAQIQAGSAIGVSRSDGTGRFHVYNVPAGTIQVSFYDPGTGASAWKWVTISPGLPPADMGTVALSFGPPPPPI